MNIKYVIALAAVLCAPIAASAATITADQGLRSDGTAVPADRSVVAAVSDGDPATFYSLGIDGTLSIDVAPEVLSGGSVVEVTFNAPAPLFPESAKVYLGGSISGGSFDMTGATYVGELFNDGTATGAGITAALGTDSSIFSITIDPSWGFSMITLVDTTWVNFAGDYKGSRISDGFDVSEFAVTTPVPLPAAAWMLLLGLGGLAGVRRMRSAA